MFLIHFTCRRISLTSKLCSGALDEDEEMFDKTSSICAFDWI
jgi:hypothetical protein